MRWVLLPMVGLPRAPVRVIRKRWRRLPSWRHIGVMWRGTRPIIGMIAVHLLMLRGLRLPLVMVQVLPWRLLLIGRLSIIGMVRILRTRTLSIRIARLISAIGAAHLTAFAAIVTTGAVTALTLMMMGSIASLIVRRRRRAALSAVAVTSGAFCAPGILQISIRYRSRPINRGLPQSFVIAIKPSTPTSMKSPVR